MKFFINVNIFITIILYIFPLQANAQTEEYYLKAVFLERFTRFIEWPGNSTLSDQQSPFILGIIGKSPFGNILEKMYSSQNIMGRSVKLVYLKNFDDIENCNLLFISSSEKERVEKILSITKAKPILTIGDTEEYGKKGVLINFLIMDKKIKFEINDKAAQDSGLKICSLLLKKGEISK